VLEKASAVRDALRSEPSETSVSLGVGIPNADQDGSPSERQRSDNLQAQSSHDAQVRMDEMQREIEGLKEDKQAALERVEQLKPSFTV
jgi:hypothetical protein